MRVFIYWNLRRRCFSVKALSGLDKGRVVAHCAYFEMTDVEFRVSEAGRQRVLRTGRKNVHAGVVGRLVETSNEQPAYAYSQDGKPTSASRSVRYNPHKDAVFVAEHSTSPGGGIIIRHPASGSEKAWGYRFQGAPRLFAEGVVFKYT